MNTIGIIPVRMDSTRFYGKPMANICGIPMVGHCFYRSCLALGSNKVFVATCDKIIADYIISIGGQVVLTSKKHKRATTRTAEAKRKIEKKYKDKIEAIVMIQGDEPTINNKSISEVAKELKKSKKNIINLVSIINSEKNLRDQNNVKVILNKNRQAIYYSRYPIPFLIDKSKKTDFYMQTGIIGFKSSKLDKFNNLDETILEKLESVDMNRLIENNESIDTICTNYPTISVDTRKELKAAEKLIIKDRLINKYKKLIR
tara:strand:+ start:1221 stop:1997 length:777 start_codon:yes stop_codon:yes gene_type:complete